MYSITIYTSPIYLPLSFASHTWIEINSPEYGHERLEIHSIINKKSNNYFYLNSKNPGEGMILLAIPGIWRSKKYFKNTVLYQEKGMHTKDTVLSIHNSVNKYPYLNKYHAIPGPNSNTFTQWIINNFLNDKNIKLPLNSFGKNFIKK